MGDFAQLPVNSVLQQRRGSGFNGRLCPTPCQQLPGQPRQEGFNGRLCPTPCQRCLWMMVNLIGFQWATLPNSLSTIEEYYPAKDRFNGRLCPTPCQPQAQNFPFNFNWLQADFWHDF